MPSNLVRHVLVAFCALTIGALLGPEPAARGAEPALRPNILWISIEDISPDLGCYGDAYAKTPNLDKLAGEGLVYVNAFSCAGVCAPSRSCIITGMYPTSIGTHHMRCKGVPPAYVKCFSEYLRAAGYYCTNNVKTDYQFDRPVTAWDQSSRKAHWRSRPNKRPFFCVINITSTHESRIRQPDKSFFAATARLKPADRHDPAKAQLPPYYPDTPLVRKDWARYYDLITAMDLRVADILGDLAADGLAENTVVFFWGDHGRGLPRAKRWIYDSGLRIPLIVRWPGHIEPGTKTDRLVSFVDFAPTVLSIAGVEIPAYMQGYAFLGKESAAPREYVFGHRDRMDEAYDIIRCVRDKRYKYIRNFEPYRPYAQHIAYMDQMPTMKEWRRLAAEGKLVGPQKIFFLPTKPVEEFYDLATDPHEVRNLADSPGHQADLARMRARLERWMKETGDLGLIPEPELQEKARPGGVWSVTEKPKISPAGGTFSGPVEVTITCPTEGSSIAFRTGDRKTGWDLYSRRITLTESTTLTTKACRLGYKDSPVEPATFRIVSGGGK